MNLIHDRPPQKATSGARSDIRRQPTAPDLSSDSHTLSSGSQPPEMMIGLALGSPGQSPLLSLPPEDSTSWANKDMEFQNHAASQPTNQEALSSKASRWKTFGAFFGKRPGLAQASSAPSTYQFDRCPGPVRPHGNYNQHPTQPTPTPSGIPESHIVHTHNGPPRDWIGPGQLPSTRNTLRKKPSGRRNQFIRKQVKDVNDLDSSRRSRKEGSPKPMLEGGLTGSTVRRPEAKASLLQVEIPNVELDRYSVMFSSLLQTCPQPSTNRQPSPKRQPSLLARRQANLQELTTEPAASNLERPWMHREPSSGPRAASPNRSPSFSLFPPSPMAPGRKHQKSARERSPLHRSATTPSADSPITAKFDFGNEIDQADQVIVIVHTPTEQPRPRQPSRNASVRSDADSFTTARGSPAPEAMSQPAHWKSSPRGPPSPARTPSDDPLCEAAEMSIARQISISRRQRQLLVQTAPPPKVAPQPVQPRIVDTRARGHDALRKSHHSHHVVLEDA
ncbi:MAG: hypothetical protein L6R40_000644 [Gallowayella cf. fulva]|nr:MAG: hypothetical protein L6R40_000644 [Xanthomendoza cf. fulva]